MTQILVTTGPESSGKTTLAQDLGNALSAPVVQEASRAYLENLFRVRVKTLTPTRTARKYQQADLLEIARLQYQGELNALASQPPLLVCDTDLLVIIIWSEVKYGHCDPQLYHLFEESLELAPRRYLLCDPELPWQSDPLRENPFDRDWLLLKYIDKLQALNLEFRHVKGTREQRIASALD